MEQGFLARNRRFFVLCALFLGAFLVAAALTAKDEPAPTTSERLHGPTVLREPVDIAEAIDTEAATTTVPVGRTPEPARGYKEIEVTNGGTIRGVVTFDKAPTVRTVPFTKDQQHCGGDSMKSERVVFDPASLGVANCVVYLARIEAGKAWSGEMAKDAETRALLVDQKACVYLPHVSVMRNETQIVFRNSDSAEHNVRGTRSGTTRWNLLTGAGIDVADADSYVDKVGVYTLACNLHAWMSGYVHVSEHPYMVVTDAKGAFELTDVPAGTYTLVCWHEGMSETPVLAAGEIAGYEYGPDIEMTQEVTVEGGKTAEVTFTLAAPE